jgi:O-antigen chain-terminating methyltransferase
MLDVARDRGLNVEKMDAVTALRATPNGLLAVVSAFHLIEHLSFDIVLEILAEARRALRPGGIIILETPNPENPIVSLVNFHLDPTHIRPLPPALTSFAAEHVGFSRKVTLRLQGTTPQIEKASELYSLLTDISLDYAVVAQVEGPRADDLDQAFSLQLGMDLHSSVRRFDEVHKAQILNVNKLLEDQKKEIKASIVLVNNLSDEILAMRNQLGTLSATIERSWIERLFFHPSNGRPTSTLRRLLFHKSGKPRGIFRKWVLKPDGRPRRAFRQWMTGPDYLAHPWPVSRRMDAEFEPEENLVGFDPHRPRPAGLPADMMTIEELVAKTGRSSDDGR